MPATPIFPNKRERNDFWIAAIVMLLFGYFVYAVAFNDRDDDELALIEMEAPRVSDRLPDGSAIPVFLRKDQRRPTEVVPEPLPAKKVVIVQTVPTLGNVTPLPTETETEQITLVAPELPVRNTRPLLNDPTTAVSEVTREVARPSDPIVQPRQPAASEQPATATIEQPTPNANSSTTASTTTPATPPTTRPTPIPKQPATTTPVQESSCVLVAGSFSTMVNRAEFKKDLIARADFELVEGQLSNGLYYVGIPVSCADRSSQKTYSKVLSEKFDEQAWLLRQ